MPSDTPKTRGILPVWQWAGALMVVCGLLLGFAALAYSEYRFSTTDLLPLAMLGWAISALLGCGLWLAWVWIAGRQTHTPFAAKAICYSTAGVAMIILLLRVISPLITLPDNIRLYELYWVIFPGLFVIILACNTVIFLLRNSVDAPVFRLTSLSVILCTVLLCILTAKPQLTDTDFRATPEEALEMELEWLGQDAEASSATIFQKKQLGDSMVLWWRLKPQGYWYYISEDEHYSLSYDKWCNKVLYLEYKRTIYGFGWSPWITWVNCDDNLIDFSGGNGIMYGYGFHKTGKVVRITWKDGRTDEVDLIDGYYLTLRAETFEDYPLRNTRVQIIDAQGNVVFEKSDWSK